MSCFKSSGNMGSTRLTQRQILQRKKKTAPFMKHGDNFTKRDGKPHIGVKKTTSTQGTRTNVQNKKRPKKRTKKKDTKGGISGVVFRTPPSPFSQKNVMCFCACPGVVLDIREGQPRPPPLRLFFLGGGGGEGIPPSFFVSAGLLPQTDISRTAALFWTLGKVNCQRHLGEVRKRGRRGSKTQTDQSQSVFTFQKVKI